MSIRTKEPRLQTTSDVDIIRPAIFDEAGISAAYTTRAGGVSSEPFDSLNLGLHVGDEDTRVLENRRLVATELELDPSHLTAPVQTHGDRVAIVGPGDRGRGALSWHDGIPQADALVTSEPGLPLMVVAADCLLLAIADPETGVIAAVHCSRRSALLSIAARTVAVMTEDFGGVPARMIASMGPHIRDCCYEVGEDVAAEARAALGPGYDLHLRHSDDGRLTFRLAALVTGQLLDAGIPEANISDISLCTACVPGRFYSYRRDGASTGRQALFVWKHL